MSKTLTKKIHAKLCKATEIVNDKRPELEFGGFFSGIRECKLEFLLNDSLYDITLTNLNWDLDMELLVELILEKIEIEINKTKDY